MRTRKPAVLGSWYSADGQQLASDVRSYLAAASPTSPPPKAIIAPHAGYDYSGPVAGSAFAPLAPIAADIHRVVLLGPSHFVPIPGIATGRATAFETPLGLVEVDKGVEDELENTFTQVRCLAAAHSREHSIEVELPFLQVLLPSFEIVALVVGDASPVEVGEVIERLWGGLETLIVVSSDLSHYLTYEAARELDAETADTIEQARGGLSADNACGFRAINGLLEVVRSRGLSGSVLDLRNSGDTAGGRDSVVGYGAFAFG